MSTRIGEPTNKRASRRRRNRDLQGMTWPVTPIGKLLMSQEILQCTFGRRYGNISGLSGSVPPYIAFAKAAD